MYKSLANILYFYVIPLVVSTIANQWLSSIFGSINKIQSNKHKLTVIFFLVFTLLRVKWKINFSSSFLLVENRTLTKYYSLFCLQRWHSAFPGFPTFVNQFVCYSLLPFAVSGAFNCACFQYL